MSVTMRLVHRTGYTYTGPATQSYNEARLTPLSSARQTVLHSRVDVTPTPWMEQWTDYWGTTVTSFELHEPHEELKVVCPARSSAGDPSRASWSQLDSSTSNL